jgi:hypothetical protein
MVVEHTFVTTLEAAPTMQAAMQFLAGRGFERADSAAFSMSKQWDTLEMRRGKRKAGKARNIAELPLTAHVQWDRGRVTTALSIEPSHAWGGSQYSFAPSFGSTQGNPKKMKVHAELLMAIAAALEGVLVRGDLPDAAGQAITAIEEKARHLARRRMRRNLIIIALVFLSFVGLIVLLTLAK